MNNQAKIANFLWSVADLIRDSAEALPLLARLDRSAPFSEQQSCGATTMPPTLVKRAHPHRQQRRHPLRAFGSPCAFGESRNPLRYSRKEARLVAATRSRAFSNRQPWN